MPKYDESRSLHVTDRAAWRAWLQANYHKEVEVWLVSYKKHTGKPAIPYNDAVEEALCFGWIDSVMNRLDEDRIAQRYSPRRPKTSYSQANQERLALLARAGKIAPDVLAALDWIDPEAYVMPGDILAALQANALAWANAQTYSPAYMRIRVAFIDGARKRPAEFAKRLAYFIRMCEQNKLFGHGGIDKYY